MQDKKFEFSSPAENAGTLETEEASMTEEDLMEDPVGTRAAHSMVIAPLAEISEIDLVAASTAVKRVI